MSGEEDERNRAIRKAQAIELRRLATRISELLDNPRRAEEKPGSEPSVATGRANDEPSKEPLDNARRAEEKPGSEPSVATGRANDERSKEPLDVGLLRHLKSTRQETRLLAHGRNPEFPTKYQRLIATLSLAAEYGLACALDGAQLDPTEVPLADTATSITWDAPRTSLDARLLMEVVYQLQPAFARFDGARERIGALQHQCAVGATDASDPVVRTALESRANTAGRIMDLTTLASDLLTQLKFDGSSRPAMRRDLRVPPLVGLLPSEFDLAITDLFVNLRSAGLEAEDLERIAYYGTPDPPKEPLRALGRRLDRRKAQRQAPTEKEFVGPSPTGGASS